MSNDLADRIAGLGRHAELSLTFIELPHEGRLCEAGEAASLWLTRQLAIWGFVPSWDIFATKSVGWPTQEAFGGLFRRVRKLRESGQSGN